MTRKGKVPGRLTEDPKHLAFCRNIHSLRIAKGWTQDGLGEVIGVEKSRISQWESGKEYPNLLTILRIADVFMVHPSLLLLTHPNDSVLIDGSVVYKWPF